MLLFLQSWSVSCDLKSGSLQCSVLLCEAPKHLVSHHCSDTKSQFSSGQDTNMLQLSWLVVSVCASCNRHTAGLENSKDKAHNTLHLFSSMSCMCVWTCVYSYLRMHIGMCRCVIACKQPTWSNVWGFFLLLVHLQQLVHACMHVTLCKCDLVLHLVPVGTVWGSVSIRAADWCCSHVGAAPAQPLSPNTQTGTSSHTFFSHCKLQETAHTFHSPFAVHVESDSVWDTKWDKRHKISVTVAQLNFCLNWSCKHLFPLDFVNLVLHSSADKLYLLGIGHD